MIPLNLCIDGHSYTFSSQDDLEDKIIELFERYKERNLDPYFRANKELYWRDVSILNEAYSKVLMNLITLARSKFYHTTEDSLEIGNFAGYLIRACRNELKRITGIITSAGLRGIERNNPVPRITDWDIVNENDLRDDNREDVMVHILDALEEYLRAPLRGNENRERRKLNYKRLIDIVKCDFDNELLAIRWDLNNVNTTRQRKSRLLIEFENWIRENRDLL
jgi:hypothetical protein